MPAAGPTAVRRPTLAAQFVGRLAVWPVRSVHPPPLLGCPFACHAASGPGQAASHAQAFVVPSPSLADARPAPSAIRLGPSAVLPGLALRQGPAWQPVFQPPAAVRMHRQPGNQSLLALPPLALGVPCHQ